MALAAPGLRAMPSTALATALACPKPQRPEAIAIPKAALMATQCPPAKGWSRVWADRADAAISMIATANNNFFVIRFSFDKSLQEVVPGHRTAGQIGRAQV